MKDEKHYEHLYTLDSFLKFERKIYQFAGLTFGRPIKLKFLLYLLIIFAILLVWRFIPVLNLPIKWIPIVILLIISGVGAWLLADIGTENRNPLKYFKSFISYHNRRMKQVTYYRGKEIPKLKDYDMSGHTLFTLPSEPLEVNNHTLPFLDEIEGNEAVNQQDLIYTSAYKPTFSEAERTKHQQVIAAHYEPVPNLNKLPINEPVQRPNMKVAVKDTVNEKIQEISNENMLVEKTGIEPTLEVIKSGFEKVEITPNEVEVSAKLIQTMEYLPSLIESFERSNDDLPSVENVTSIEPTVIEPIISDNFEQVEFTPIVRKAEIETTDKIKEIEDSIFYLKIDEINKLSSKDKETDLEDKQSIIEKLIEKTLEAIEKRKQVKRYKNRKKKG